MKRPDGNRARLGGVLLAVAVVATAILALPALGFGHKGGSHGPRAAGTIESFDKATGQLVVDLRKGGTISARVVRRTKIRCGEDGRRHRRQHHGGERASASRRGEPVRAEDRGGRGEEPGEDRDGRGEGEPGDDRGGRSLEPGGNDHAHGNPDRGDRCNAGDLVPGAVVMRAEIVLTHGDALFAKIGLLPPQAAGPEPEEEGAGAE